MGVHIWHLVLALCVFTEFKAYATELTESESNFENVSIISNNTLMLVCPKKSSNWILVSDQDGPKGEVIKNNSDTLELRPVTPQHRGIYSCVDNEGQIVKKYNLTVLEPPHFTKKMEKLIVKPAGNTLRLICKAGGVPPPNITWYKDDISPPKRELGDIKTNHWSLILEDLVPNDKGNYTCVVCNIAGCINFTFFVDVVERYHNRPILLTGLDNSTVLAGSNITLSCKFVSDLRPYITWTRLLNDSYEYEYSVVLQKSDSGNVNPEVYEIVNVTHEDEGWYACFASNSLGTIVSKAYMQVVDEEPRTNKLETSSSKTNVHSGLHLKWKLIMFAYLNVSVVVF